jgi:hypothetical protein
MWLWVGNLVDAMVGWLLDGAARGERMPDGAAVVGLVLAAVGAATLAVLAVRASRRVVEPEPEPGLGGRPWWATKATDGDTELQRRPGYRGQRRASRHHVVPAHPARPEPVTELIPRIADDPDATIAIPTRDGGR